jgi:hypothetical protein
MAADLDKVFLNVADFGEVAAFFARGNDPSFQLPLVMGDGPANSSETNGLIGQQRQVEFTCNRTTFRDLVAKAEGEPRDALQGDVIETSEGRFVVSSSWYDTAGALMMSAIQADALGAGRRGGA